MAQINGIKIVGLNEHATFEIKFRGRNCIIVGPNGVGKSTALQISAYALGRQWGLLSKQRFTSIEVSIGAEKLHLSREACAAYSSSPKRRGMNFIDRFPTIDAINEFLHADLEQPSEIRKYESQFVSRAEIRRAQSLLRDDSPSASLADTEVIQFAKDLERLSVPRVLFLPTSRRIEFDLARVTDRLPEYVRSQISEAFQKQSSIKFFEEIIRFGMDDIDQILRSFEQKTRDVSRAKFNRMMSTLLKDMANEEAISVKAIRETNVNSEKVQNVLARIEENVISVPEREKISEILTSLTKPGSGNPPFHKKWLAHFFVRLMGVSDEMTSSERPMREFVSVIQKYLRPKNAVYDIEKYHFGIFAENGKDIALNELSSGEKQLVSLFAMLGFSTEKSLVLIDEPELSLSAVWQTTFLEDLVRFKSCAQLIAVTHSPFVFENSLASSVIDFETCRLG
ncbi:MAG: AAA family ATPase [Paracoccaceae bacterium]|nr:MAG: AAA family ATPase [Paracoccaceae bacterium]